MGLGTASDGTPEADGEWSAVLTGAGWGISSSRIRLPVDLEEEAGAITSIPG